ncbi:hypothetical protein XA68_16502 [Ophiocordyceps unilateralis]|uniref:Uncharacterized protein n=1 Tax=Ophiocordyceps unilateralis TaxID=268505 RepID=A0A2A9PLD7_OPHUN|nr:hypothetical protein XA68_16502 [Ophiocordyceps unilateralis]
MLQPLCGECAVLYFSRTDGHQAAWLRGLDSHALVTRSHETYTSAVADGGALLHHVIQTHPWRESDNVIPLPDEPSENIGDEIPKEDETYVGLGDELIAHPVPRFPATGVYLFQFITFEGAVAYQPCSIDIGRLFDVLEPLETNCDPIFKQARTWSCSVQAMPFLPKELRWILATVYNFSCEMLRAEVDEMILWQWRAWLMFWYEVFERIKDTLYVRFSYLCTPEPDWYCHPRPLNHSAPQPSGPVHNEAVGQSSPRSSGGNTVMRRGLPGQNQEAASLPIPTRYRDSTLAVQAWLDSQPNLDSFNLLGELGVPVRSQLDPRAAVFRPLAGEGMRTRSDSGYMSAASAVDKYVDQS